MLVPWALGFVAYQLINPGYLAWLGRLVAGPRPRLGFTPAPWMSASILSCAAAGLATLVLSRFGRSAAPQRDVVTDELDDDARAARVDGLHL